MADARDPKGRPVPPRWPIDAQASSRAPEKKPSPADVANSHERGAGRIRHDERGNAVWDWVKETGRFCIESTSRLLKRLEVPELKVQKDDELRLEDEGGRDAGGGYDPYNQKTPAGRPGKFSGRK